MKRRYRVVTAISESGNEMFVLQTWNIFWPFWVDVSRHMYEEYATRALETEKKKDAYKGRVVRLG